MFRFVVIGTITRLGDDKYEASVIIGNLAAHLGHAGSYMVDFVSLESVYDGSAITRLALYAPDMVVMGSSDFFALDVTGDGNAADRAHDNVVKLLIELYGGSHCRLALATGREVSIQDGGNTRAVWYGPHQTFEV